MKLKKLAISIAVTSAVGLTGAATAGITGVPGEGLLVPMVLNTSDGVDTGAETYVAVVVPTDIGLDTVTQFYTAPNVAPGNQTVTDNDFIYWVLYDENSKVIEDGTCETSLGDKVVWSTDASTYRETQEEERDAATSIGGGLIPNPVCGPTSDDWKFGYVAFMSNRGAIGEAANFAMTGDAWILEDVLTDNDGEANMASVPVMPMADGDDALTVGVGGPPINNFLIGLQNEIVSVNSEELYNMAPIASGNRMNNGVGPSFPTQRVLMQADLRGPATGGEDTNEQSLHVFWFDQVKTRNTPVEIWDDAEGSCTDNIPLPRELNLVLFNNDSTITDATPGWDTIGNEAFNDTGRHYTDVISAVYAEDYTSPTYCAPTYWEPRDNIEYPGALNGYVEYRFFEEFFPGNPLAFGSVDSSAVAFNWQESLADTVSVTDANAAWSSHMTQYLGVSISILGEQ
jgi:hypothetical protein